MSLCYTNRKYGSKGVDNTIPDPTYLGVTASDHDLEPTLV